MDASTLTVEDIEALIPSWELSLRADRKAPGTITTYRKGVTQLLDYARENHLAPLDRTTVRSWLTTRMEDGTSPVTMKSRLMAVRRFVAWAVAEEEIDTDPLAGIKPPKSDTEIVQPLTDDELRALLAACAVPKGATADETFRGRRDEALLRLMLEAGLRAGEVLALTVDDVDLAAGTALVRRGKGGKGRIVPFGPRTSMALDKYRRARLKRRLADSSAFWLGARGRGLAYGGLNWALNARAEAAGVAGFHPHRMRHTAAHRWLAAGGSDSGLMAVAGWSSPAMLTRYTRARATDRALAESRALNLGEL